MEHQTPSVFPGNFRKRKVLGTLCFPFCLPEKLVQAKAQLAHELAAAAVDTGRGAHVKVFVDGGLQVGLPNVVREVRL